MGNQFKPNNTMNSQQKMFLDPKSQLTLPLMTKRNSHMDRRTSKLQERSKSRPTSAASTGKAARRQSKVRRVSQMIKPAQPEQSHEPIARFVKDENASSRQSFGSKKSSASMSTNDNSTRNRTFTGAVISFKQIGPPERMDRMRKDAYQRAELTKA